MGNYLNLLLDYVEHYPEIFLLLFLSVLDVVSGILAAKATHSLSSNTGYRGIIKKTFMWIVVAMASAINLYQPIIPLRIIACGGFCIVECMSIIENAGRAGVKLPLPLVRGFKLLDFLYQQKVSAALDAIGGTGATTSQQQQAASVATPTAAADQQQTVQQVMVMTPEQLQAIIEKMLGNYAPVTPKESAAIAEVVTNQTARRYGSGELKIKDDGQHTGNNQSE